MTKSWSQSDWQIKAIFVFFLLRGILFFSVLTFYTVILIKLNLYEVWELIKQVIKEENISTASIVIGISMWVIRLSGIYFSWLLVQGHRLSKQILEFITWLIIFLASVSLFLPQFISSNSESILEKNLHYFLSEQFLLGVIVLFCNILVLIGLRSHSTVRYVNQN